MMKITNMTKWEMGSYFPTRTALIKPEKLLSGKER